MTPTRTAPHPPCTERICCSSSGTPGSGRSNGTRGTRWCGSTTPRPRWRSGGLSHSRSGPSSADARRPWVDAPSAAWRRTLRAMSDQMARFRDARGRVTSLGALLGFTLAGLVTGVAALVVIDAVTALLGRGDFGHANGWLAVVLPVWLFILEELRAWRGVTGRLVLAGSGLLVGLALGLVAANAVAELPP